MGNLKLCIDAGHGSWTAGKRTAPFTKDIDIDSDGKIDIKKGQQYREHFANVMVASFLDDILRKYGIDIIKTGWDDEDGYDDPDASIESRQSVIRKAACDYVISIHFNASCSNLKQFDNANGVSVYVRTEKEKRGDSDKLAKALLNELVKGTSQKNRGIGTGKFGMCNAKGMNVKAGVIVELAFMTNEHEAQDMMANKEFCLECAKELAEGFINYVTDGQPDQPVLKTSNKNEVMWLQMMLNAQITKKKIEDKYLTIDGQYGAKTADAVRLWQKYKRWTVGSGFFVGVNTLQSLNK